VIHENYANFLERKEHRHLYENPDIGKHFLMESVLVTGAGGSIGSAIVNRLARESLDTIYAVGHGEDSIFQLINSPNVKKWNASVVPIIAEAWSDRVLDFIRKKKVSCVIHAAAHKHVGLMETNVQAAYENNVTQTLGLAEICDGAGIKFVFISTDKAVKPTTVMGATKRIAEAAIRAHYPNNTVVCRFGNVLGSAGSIIEIVKQKKARKEMMIIYRGMKRYFITAREAVGLVLTSAPSTGTFLLDMGDPLDIFGIVKKAGFPESQIVVQDQEIKGEKLVEDLWSDRELIQRTGIPGVRAVFSGFYPHLVRAVLKELEESLEPMKLVDLANRI